MISKNRAAAVVRDNKTCYAALQLNQYVTPDGRDKMMTKKFMRGVLDGTYWMPKSE